MVMTAAEYKNQLVQLLPPGVAWDLAPDGGLDRLLSGMAVEFSRVDRRGDDLIKETDPRTTYELLEDWERVMGLPDDCTSQFATIEERRQQIVARLTMLGGQSIAFLKSVATALGYTVEIEEYAPFRVDDRAGDRVYGLPWVHVFSLISSSGSERVFRASQSYAGERLMEYGDEVLECIINRAKPAHSFALFEYL